MAGLAGAPEVLQALDVPALLLAAAAAGYSAFLFGQAEGRDFWQSPLHLPHLLAGAVAAGAAALIVLQVLIAPAETRAIGALRLALVGALSAHAGLLALDLFGHHASVDVARAARLLTEGAWARRFWGGVVAGGIALPMVLAWWGPAGAMTGAVLALAGLWLYEDLWVKAGQSVPLS